jgi:hypothetical protein
MKVFTIPGGKSSLNIPGREIPHPGTGSQDNDKKKEI